MHGGGGGGNTEREMGIILREIYAGMNRCSGKWIERYRC